MIPHFLQRAPQAQTSFEIILWWESRRLGYNLIIFAAILIASLLLAASPPPAGFRAKMCVWLGLGLYVLQIPANVWYTGGWVAELLVKKVLHFSAGGFGPWTLCLGTVFSLLLIFSLSLIPLTRPGNNIGIMGAWSLLTFAAPKRSWPKLMLPLGPPIDIEFSIIVSILKLPIFLMVPHATRIRDPQRLSPIHMVPRTLEADTDNAKGESSENKYEGDKNGPSGCA